MYIIYIRYIHIIFIMESIEPSVEKQMQDVDVSVDVSVDVAEPKTTNSNVSVIANVSVENVVVVAEPNTSVEHEPEPEPEIQMSEKDEKKNSLETVVSETKNMDVETPLTNLFLSILKAENPELVSDLNLNLNKEMTNCLLFILAEHPDYFSDFGKLLSLILEDGKINLNDVPYIIALVSKTYEFVHHFKKNIKHINDEQAFEVCANIMKTVFHVLVMKNVIQIKSDENKLVLISTFDSVVDSCVNLVKLNHVLNNKGCSCFSFLKPKSKKEKTDPKPKSE